MSNEKENSMVVRNQDVLLRCNEVARILSISRSKAYMLIQTGDLTSVRIGSSVRVRPGDLQAFITHHVSGGAGQGN